VSNKDNKDLSIRDPIYGMITFDGNSVARKLIDTKEFQRLRRIKQLGFADYVYPGATHTRFSHSLGVAWLVNMAVKKLFQQKDNGITLSMFTGYKSEEQVIDTMTCAGLLHDIGHGPFSHSTEERLQLDHEERAKSIIESEQTEVNMELRTTTSLPKQAIDDIIKLIKGVPSSRLSTISSLIHSQLDCDRLDYLLRDTYFCGSPIKVDYEYIFKCMQVLQVDVLKKSDKDEALRIVYDIKAIPAIEHYLLARLVHYKSIAYHKASRSVESLFLEIIECSGLYPVMGKEIPKIEEFLSLDDNSIIHKIEQSSRDKENNKLLELLDMYRNRRMVKFFKKEHGEDKLKIKDNISKQLGKLFKKQRNEEIDVFCSKANSKMLYDNHEKAYKDLIDNKDKLVKDLIIEEVRDDAEEIIFISEKKENSQSKVIIRNITELSDIAKSSSCIDSHVNVYLREETLNKVRSKKRKGSNDSLSG